MLPDSRVTMAGTSSQQQFWHCKKVIEHEGFISDFFKVDALTSEALRRLSLANLGWNQGIQ